MANSKRKSKRPTPLVKPRSAAEVRDRIDAVKRNFAENDRRRAADLKKQWEDDLRKQILLVWNKDRTKAIPQIIKQLTFPSGYSKKNQNFSQLIHSTISTAEIEAERKGSHLEKALQRQEREEQQVKIKEQAELRSKEILRSKESEFKRADQARKAEQESQNKEGPKELKAKILSIYNDWFHGTNIGENRNQTIGEIARTLHSQPLPKGSPKKLTMLTAFVRNTLAEASKIPISGLNDRQLRVEHESRARIYAEIKAKVASSYLRLKEQPQSQSDLQSIGLTASELAFAAIAPASTDQERKEALFLTKAAGVDSPVSDVLLENFPKNPPTSKRRSNIVDALRALGKSDEVAKLLSEHGVIENTKTLEWSVLPPGWWNDPKYTDQITNNAQEGQLLIERLRYVDQLKPLERWRSQERLGSDPYWVFVFPSHVVAECPTHGNAIYIIKGKSDWRNLLNRSKADLLRAFPDRVIRITHRGDWESRLRRTIRV